MPLFHPRVLNKRLQNAGPVPQTHSDILIAWAKALERGVYDRETQHDGEFIQRILIDVLGYVGSSAGTTWTVSKNEPVGTGNVDVALGTFGVDEQPKILAPFELKGASTKDLDALMPGRYKSPVQQAWEYAMDAKGAQWVLVSNYREIRLYAVGYGRKDYEAFDLRTMATTANYNRFKLLLSADSLLSGSTLELLKESDLAGKEITDQLYAEYKTDRSILIKEITAANPRMNPFKAVQVAQTILDRVLFVAFAEDKGLLKKYTLKETFETKNPYSPQPIWENFKGLFAAVDTGNEQLGIPGYNGGLFAPEPEINALVLSDDMCKRFADLGEYDYESEVSVNILGHVFEQSIADLDEIRRALDPNAATVEEVGSKRRTDGIFYTPQIITRHIVEQAVGKWLHDQKKALGFDEIVPLADDDYASIKRVAAGKNRGKVIFNANVQKHITLWNAYRDRLSSIRVLDPACGSGAFLNEVFDYLYREGQSVNRALEELHGGQINLFRWDTHILANNIFGVDINRESVEITKLSLWLKTANRKEKLSYLDDNIRTGNSLIKDQKIAGDLAFDWKIQFPSIMKAGGFDVVVGNPPYVDSETMTKSWSVEREYIANTFQQTKGNWDLYVAFLELGCDLLAPSGYLSFITPDKWISKDFGIALRERVTPGIVSILPFGRDVFESALVDSIVTTISADPVPNLQVLALDKREVVVACEIDKSELRIGEGFDQVLSPHYRFLRKIETVSLRRLSDIALTENACATSDTYVLGEILQEAGSAAAYDSNKHYKVANTGTLDKYASRWGLRPMRYLKKDYMFPVVAKEDFNQKLGMTYQRRAASPKIMIKGLTLLDAALDLDGTYVPGKSTLVICGEDTTTLKFLAGVVNSRLASFYIRQKYASASYNGGVNFTPDMLNSLRVPNPADVAKIVANVETILAAQDVIRAGTVAMHSAVRASGGGDKLRPKFHHWFELSDADFVKELTSQGLDLSVREKAEWAAFLGESKAKVSNSLVQHHASSAAINSIVENAFELTLSERELLASDE